MTSDVICPKLYVHNFYILFIDVHMFVMLYAAFFCQELENQMGYLPGDCMIAAAFLSYLGPFLSEYREEIVNKVWISEVSSCLSIVKRL